jgi:hypothetical protein
MRPRSLAALLLVLLTALSASAGGASAAAPTAPLTAVPNPDGSQTLHWDLRGSSDSINVLPHLRCAADPSASGVFAGSAVPCLWLVDHKAPLSDGPAGCPATGQAYASWRCDMRLYRDVVIDAAASGESSLINFNTKPNGGSGICAWIPVALRLGGGEGTILAADGCRERIVCAAGYSGTVNADSLDVVSGCRTVSRTATSGPVSDSGASSGSTTDGTSAVDLSKCTGASSGRKGDSPLYSVLVKPRGARGMDVRVQLRRAVPITVEVRVKSSSGSRLVRSVARCAKAGANRVAFSDATGGVKARRQYRVFVRSANSSYPLRSAYETLPRR